MEFSERRKCPQSSAAYRARLSTKLQEIFMSDSPSLSYANFRHQFTRNVDSCLSKSSRIPQHSAVGGEAEEDEQTLNIGALDLGHLENWKCTNGSIPHMSSDYSSTKSKRTSYSSTELSTSYNSIGQSSSPAWQRMDSSLLHSHLEDSPIKAHFQANCYLGRRYSYSPAVQRTYHLVPQSHHQKVFPWGSQSQNVSNTTSGTRKSKIHDNDFAAASTKGKMRVRESDMKDTVQSRTLNQEHHSDCSKEQRKLVLLLPRDSPMNRGSTQSSDSAVSANNLMLINCRGRKSASSKGSYKDPHGSSRFSDVPSCAQHLQDDSKRRLEMRESYSTSILKVKVPTQLLESPARSTISSERKSIMIPRTPSKSHLSEEIDKRTGSESAARARQSSPIRRLSSAMGSFIRNAASRDNSPVRRSISKDIATKSVTDNATDSTSSETDKSPASCRARSSPLRRFLDPLIKPRPSNARDSVETPRKGLTSTNRPQKSSDQQLQSAKDSHQIRKKDSSPVHALLQVAFKNGLPLFTLAVNNDNSILAATLRKNGSGRIYTFFTVHTMKKKNSLWLNQGDKGKGHYVPNVIAQMKVSDIRAPGRTRQKVTNCDSIREFTLFSVDVDHVDQNATEFQPTDELAAIIVKLPKPDEGLNPSNTTLILPGGVHSLPSKGSISTLTQRWKSGGACDCGGWDLGCQLMIFTDVGESQKSSKTDEFKLFSQMGQESRLALSLNPFKDNIYSVEFDSSVSLIQAFATSVAFLDCKRPSGPLSMNNVSEERSSVSSDPARVNPRNQSRHTEAPANGNYVSYPPHSPVERV